VHVDADTAPVDLARPQHDQLGQIVMRGVIEFSFVVAVSSQ